MFFKFIKTALCVINFTTFQQYKDKLQLTKNYITHIISLV